MGTWQTFDTTADRGPIVDEALSAGITLFDSSPMYGRAEDTLAKALAGRRDEAIIATKIWTSSPAEGRQQAEHALRLFGRVEIYQVHNLVNWKAQLKMLEGLKGEGKVVAVGATHYDSGAFDDLCDVMRTGIRGIVSIDTGLDAGSATRGAAAASGRTTAMAASQAGMAERADSLSRERRVSSTSSNRVASCAGRARSRREPCLASSAYTC